MRDVYLVMEGRKNANINSQYLLRHHAAVVSEVINRTMGGNGAADAVIKMWLVDGEQPTKKEEWTPEKVTAIINKYRGRRKDAT